MLAGGGLGAFAAPPAPRRASAAALTPREAERRDAYEHFLKARLLVAEGEITEALKELRQAVDLDPEDAGLRREYAETLRDVQIWPEAEREARRALELAPANPGAWRTLGQILLATAKDRGGFEKAAEALKRSVDEQPGEPTGAQAYAQALIRLDRPSEAVPVLARVLDQARGLQTPLLYGEALERSGELDQAEEVYRPLLRQEPDNPALSLALLRVYERQRRFDKAVPLVEDFLKRQPRNLGLRIQYAQTLLRARRFDDALAQVEEVLKADPGNRESLRLKAGILTDTLRWDEADAVLLKLRELDPDDQDASFRRAVNFLEARRFSEAEAVLVALRKELVVRKADKAGIAQVDAQLGYAAFLRKDWSEARRRLLPILWGEDGVNAQALNILLQVARDEGDPAEGARLARLAVEKAPRSAQLKAQLGEFLLRGKDPKEREEGERILADLANGDRISVLLAADSWQRMERFDHAVAVASDGLKRLGPDPDLLFRLGASLERERKFDESVKVFEQLIGLRPEHHAALNYLGYMWVERGENLKMALVMITKAVALDPGNGAYLDSLGWAFFQLGRLDEAERNLLDAVRFAPDDAALEEHLGDLYERKGERERARARWAAGLKMKPEDGGKKLLERLQRTGGVPAGLSDTK